MKPEDSIKLLKQLLLKTTNGGITWEGTSGSYEFKVSFATSALILKKNDIGGVITIYELFILNDVGEVVDNISYRPTDMSKDYKLLMDLYELVYNTDLKVDKTINDLFKELDL